MNIALLLFSILAFLFPAVKSIGNFCETASNIFLQEETNFLAKHQKPRFNQNRVLVYSKILKASNLDLPLPVKSSMARILKKIYNSENEREWFLGRISKIESTKGPGNLDYAQLVNQFRQRIVAVFFEQTKWSGITRRLEKIEGELIGEEELIEEELIGQGLIEQDSIEQDSIEEELIEEQELIEQELIGEEDSIEEHAELEVNCVEGWTHKVSEKKYLEVIAEDSFGEAEAECTESSESFDAEFIEDEEEPLEFEDQLIQEMIEDEVINELIRLIERGNHQKQDSESEDEGYGSGKDLQKGDSPVPLTVQSTVPVVPLNAAQSLSEARQEAGPVVAFYRYPRTLVVEREKKSFFSRLWTFVKTKFAKISIWKK